MIPEQHFQPRWNALAARLLVGWAFVAIFIGRKSNKQVLVGRDCKAAGYSTCASAEPVSLGAKAKRLQTHEWEAPVTLIGVSASFEGPAVLWKSPYAA
jgi:hypothetical protein